MTGQVDVLDKGFVRLVDTMGSDLTVVNSARVSFNKRKTEFDQADAKLLLYLAKHNHFTPFTHIFATFHIKCPIFVRTQLFKHKIGLTENEVSRRYVSFTPDIYIPEIIRGKPAKSIKQGSTDSLPKRIQDNSKSSISMLATSCVDLYENLLSQGVAPEQARMILPQSMYTEFFWSGSIAAFSRVYSLRSSEDAQWETRQYASAISDLLSPIFPVSWCVLIYAELPAVWKKNEEDKKSNT